ncbi:MAG: hypothetical protein KatS3mg065_1072 [Chloroflexota bacterium]|nr:MAG: hypothetical protein KatS3mg065_1072 [Chloroflexota bacterium]
MARPDRAGHHEGMERLAVRPPSPPPHVKLQAVVGLLISIGLIGGGVAAGWFVATTPFLASLVSARPTTSQTILGAVGWAAGLSLPILLTGAGLLRLARVVGRLRDSGPRSPFAGLLDALPDEHALVEGIRLSDGRRVEAVVVGPFGAAVLEPLPPRGMARRRGDFWELRVGPREYVPIENPLARATRNAERFRRWLAEEAQDHVVRVYAAVVGSEPGLERTAACAVVAPDELAAWFAALPSQRGFTPWRRQRLLERLAERLD